MLVAVGDVFLVDTLVFANGDHAEKRPVVVVRAPKHDLDYMTVVQRSSTVRDRQGVDHPRDPELGLHRDGRWILDYARTVRADQFLESAEFRGRLASRWLDPLGVGNTVMAAGPLAEIREGGRMGPLAADLVYRTVDAVRRFDRYPPPEGRRHWDADAVQEAAHDFVAADGFAARLARLAGSANDEESFARVMQTAVRNHFRMQARRTDTGAALRAVSHLLDTDDAVIATPGASPTSWTLPAYADRPAYAGKSDDLVAAARSVTDVRRAPWSQASKRRSPIADRDSLRRVVHAVLAAAEAPVERSQILGALLARFPFVVTRPVLAADDILMPPSQPADDVRLQAAEIWNQLSDNERLVLGCLHEPVRSIAEETGLSRSAAHRASVSARAALADLLADVTDQGQVVARLAEASGVLRRRGTEFFDSASSDSREGHETATPH